MKIFIVESKIPYCTPDIEGVYDNETDAEILKQYLQSSNKEKNLYIDTYTLNSTGKKHLDKILKRNKEVKSEAEANGIKYTPCSIGRRCEGSGAKIIEENNYD